MNCVAAQQFVAPGRSFLGRFLQSCGTAGLRGSPVSSEPEFSLSWLPAVLKSLIFLVAPRCEARWCSEGVGSWPCVSSDCPPAALQVLGLNLYSCAQVCSIEQRINSECCSSC